MTYDAPRAIESLSEFSTVIWDLNLITLKKH